MEKNQGGKAKNGHFSENIDRQGSVKLVQWKGFLLTEKSMIIQYYGDFCFKITTKPEGRGAEDVIIWTDPLPKGAGLRSPQGDPDILLISHGESPEVASQTALLDMPGEFAARGVTIAGYNTFTAEVQSDKKDFNTTFLFDSESIQVGYLGALGHEPDPEVLDRFSGIEILFVPVESKEGWDTKTALSVIKKIEPKVIIPMHFAQKGLTIDGLASEKSLVDALGGKVERVSKLNIKKKDIENESMKVIILERGA
jgi:hypothetical protein